MLLFKKITLRDVYCDTVYQQQEESLHWYALDSEQKLKRFYGYSGYIRNQVL